MLHSVFLLARLLVRSNRQSHITPILKSLHWLLLSFTIQFRIFTLGYRARQGPTPLYVVDRIYHHSSPRPLRSNMLNLLPVPCTRRSSFRGRSSWTLECSACTPAVCWFCGPVQNRAENVSFPTGAWVNCVLHVILWSLWALRDKLTFRKVGKKLKQ